MGYWDEDHRGVHFHSSISTVHPYHPHDLSATLMAEGHGAWEASELSSYALVPFHFVTHHAQSTVKSGVTLSLPGSEIVTYMMQNSFEY